jgi:DNA (cytosine-5)-methyltransferase 1
MKKTLRTSLRGSQRRSLDESKARSQLRLWDDSVVYDVARRGNGLVRTVQAGRFLGRSSLSFSQLPKSLQRLSLEKAWRIAELRGLEPKQLTAPVERIRVLDLFCGAGGFTAGVVAAANAVGISAEPVAAVDLDAIALAVYRKNNPNAICVNANVDSLVDYAVTKSGATWRFSYPPQLTPTPLANHLQGIDLVIGGPPCQGHSNLNNITRRDDPRNNLYLTVPAIGVAVNARAILIENVQSVTLDKARNVDKAKDCLQAAGYHVDDAVLEGARLGVPQMRKRYFLIATRSKGATALHHIHEILASREISSWEAISDLSRKATRARLYDSPATLSLDNQMRVDHLFDRDLYDLPDNVRPECHRDGHTYPSVYGRMHKDRPAQTLTCGFMSPGRGRFIHPTQRRGLTPHEGARLQGFPDSYDFCGPAGVTLHRKDLAKLIGDAVPPPMGCAAALMAFATL